jgi:hypothetical protein
MGLLGDAVGAGVDVHRIAAQERNERDARLDGKFYSQRGRRRHGSEDGRACHHALLRELE